MKKSSKALSLLIVAVLLLNMVIIPIAADDTPTITIVTGDEFYKAGNTINVPVIISGNIGIATYEITISFDETQLIYKGCDEENEVFAKAVAFVPSYESGNIIVTASNDDGGYVNSYKDGKLFSLSFEIANNVTENILLTMDSVETYNADTYPPTMVPANGINGEIKISEPVAPTIMVATVADKKAGDEVEVQVSFSGNPGGVTGYGFEILFNPEELQYLGCDNPKELFQLPQSFNPNNANSGIFQISVSNGTSPTNENGKLAIIKFKILDDVKDDILLTIRNANIRISGITTYVSGIDGKITIEKCDHDWGTGEVTTPATCVAAGVMTYTCSICGDTYTEPIAIDPLNHIGETYEEVIKAATYDDEGLMGIYCKSCDELISTSVIPKLICPSHDYVDVVTTPATCVAAGVMTYTCSICGDTYTEAIAIDPLNHIGETYEKVITAATYDDEGEMGIYCKSCDELLSTSVIPKLICPSHNYVDVVTTPATCIAAGVRTYTCSICGDTYTEAIAIDPLNHIGGTYEKVITAATYDTNGIMGIYCNSCDELLDTRAIGMMICEHDWGTGIVTTPATCVSTGVMTYTCLICGGTKTEEIAINPTNHVGNTYKAEITAATCVAKGTMGIYCEDCGELLDTEEIAIDADNHVGETYDKTITAATCIAVGEMGTYCNDCDELLSTKEIAIDPLNHDGETYDKAITAATCIAVGEMGTYCSDCDELLGTKEIAIDANNHDGETYEEVITAATCIAVGVMGTYCSDCDELLSTKEIAKDPTNHVGGTYEETITAATYDDEGVMGIYCNGCDVLLSTSVIPKITCEHNYTSVVTTPATCASEGVMTYTCSICDDTYTEPIAKNPDNHVGGTYEEAITEATYDDEGEMGIYCSGCDVLLSTSVIPKLICEDHDYTSVVTAPATCIAAGIRTYTCSICGDTYTEPIAKNPDNHVGGTYEAAITPATCASTGEMGTYCGGCGELLGTSTIAINPSNHVGGTYEFEITAATYDDDGEMGIYCSGCDVLLSTRVIPARVHDYVGEVTKVATCAEEGEMTYSCEECGGSYTEPIAKNPDNHVGGTYEAAIRPATCVSTGEMGIYCGGCDELLDTRDIAINPDNHVGGTYEAEITAATYTADGLMGTYCNSCKELLGTSVIPMLVCSGHDYVGVVTTPATCVATGIKTYTCSICGDSYTESIAIDADNHVGGTYEFEITPATYDDEGEMGIYCNSCDVLIETRVIPVLKHTYTVKFDSDNGDEDTTIPATEGEKTNKPGNPKKTDYIFVGWYDGEKEFNFDDPITGDLNLTAKWVPDKIKPKNESSFKIDLKDFMNGTEAEDGTTLGDLLDGLINENIYIQIRDLNGNLVTDPSTLLGTGMLVELWVNGEKCDTRIAVVKFDLNGNGNLDDVDYEIFSKYFGDKKINELSKAMQLALGVTGDSAEDFIAFMAFCMAYSSM